MRRDDICLYLGPADRAKLEAIVADRNSPRKWCWRAEIVLATANGLGTKAIMRRTGRSKPCVWRWQERYIDEGVPGLLHDKTTADLRPWYDRTIWPWGVLSSIWLSRPEGKDMATRPVWS